MSGISRRAKLFVVGAVVFFLLLFWAVNSLHDFLISFRKVQYIPLPGFLSVIRTPDVVLSFGPDLGDNNVSRFWWNERYLVVETETRDLAEGESPQTATFLLDLKNVLYCELGSNPNLDEISRSVGETTITLRDRKEAYSQRELELGYPIYLNDRQLESAISEMYNEISPGLHFFKEAKHRYPDSLLELRSWPSRWQEVSLIDPWGHAYEYRNKGDDYDLGSRGPVEEGPPLMLPDHLKFPGKEWTKVSYSEMIAGAN